MNYTKEQINKKFKGMYIEFMRFWNGQRFVYKIINKSKSIKENMTLGEDVGTTLEYTR